MRALNKGCGLTVGLWMSLMVTGYSQPVQGQPYAASEAAYRSAPAVSPPTRADATATGVVAGAVVCPPGALIEPEPCQTDEDLSQNGGCNDPGVVPPLPEQYTDIASNQTVCGTASTFSSDAGGNSRDTDWYRFTIPVESDVEWCATAEFRVRLFMLQETCPAASLGTASGDPMVLTCVSTHLAAGTYVAFVATDSFLGIPCGANNNYVATLRAGARASLTYQGQLKRDGAPFNGPLDIRFRLFDADVGGVQIGPTNTRNAVDIVNGLFTVQLDFGSGPFDGNPRFLEIAVDDVDIPLTTLTPRQPVTFAPQSAFAQLAGQSRFADEAVLAVSADTARAVDWPDITNVPAGVTDFHSLDASDGSPIDALFVNSTGNVGIGTTSPSNRLTVSGNANFTGFVGIGVAAPDTPLDVARSAGTVGAFNRLGSGGAVVAIQQDGITEGTISVSGVDVSYNAFTGSHYAWSTAPIAGGALVSMTGENRTLGDRSHAEVIYGIAETTKANDPACLGVHLGPMESTQELGPDNPRLVAAVGNGGMWVVDRGGDIEPGDYLISSDVSGSAMKDDPSRFPIGYIVARAAERVRWNDVPEGVDSPKRRRISVLFEGFVRHSTTDELSRRLHEQGLELAEMKARLAKLEAMQSHSGR